MAAGDVLLAFLPQFVSSASESVAQFSILGLLFRMLTLIATTSIAYFSGGLGDWIKDRSGFVNRLKWLMGSALVGLALADRR